MSGNVIKMLYAGGYGAKAVKILQSGKEVSVRTPTNKKEWVDHLKRYGVGSREVQYKAINLMDKAGFIEYAARKHGKGRDLARREFIGAMLKDPIFMAKGMAFLRSVLATYYAAMPSKHCRYGLKARIKSFKWFSEKASVCRRFVNKALTLLTDVNDKFHIHVVMKIKIKTKPV